MKKTDKNMKRQQRFIKMVSHKLNKKGFECQMVENHFIVAKDGRPFEVKMWETPGLWKRRVHFLLSFAFEGMEQVMPEALMWLASESNNRSDYTTTRFMSDHFSCCVETSVRSTQEFVREFRFAFNQIAITYKDLSANYSNIKVQFRESPVYRPIGFLADRYMAEEEKNNVCKLVAQTYFTFAAEN